MERCPNCRARLDGAETCRRCGMELGLLRATEQAAEAWLCRAIGHLTRNEPGLAQQALHRVLALRPDPLADSLLGFLRANATLAASSEDEVDVAEAEVAADQAERNPAHRLRALYDRLLRRR